MSDKFFLDSNVCLYLFDEDKAKVAIAESLFTANAVISTQVLAETANVLTKKFLFSKEKAMETIRFIRNKVEAKPVTPALLDVAAAIFIRYNFSFYDSMIIAAALDSDCHTLYSEDMQHNQKIEGKLTIINPFL